VAPLAWLNKNFDKLVIVEEGQPQNPGKTPRERGAPTTNSAHIWHPDKIETCPRWWEARSLTTVPVIPAPLMMPNDTQGVMYYFYKLYSKTVTVLFNCLKFWGRVIT